MRKRLARIVGTVVCLVCLVFFAREIFDKWDGVGRAAWLIAGRPGLIVAEFGLMGLGVFIETLRWSALRRGFMGGRLTDDFLATLRSIALGNSTPMNLGEHLGRGMTYSRHRLATVVSVLSSVVQTAAILTLGFVGGLCVASLGMRIPVAGLVALCAAIGAALFGLAIVWRKRRRRLAAARAIGGSFGLSILKTLNFSFQLYLLLLASAFMTDGLFAAVLFYYLCITVTPRVNILDVGVKGAWAAGIFCPWVADEGIYAATVCLWVVNIVLPSVVGYAVLLVGRFRSR